MNEVRVSLSTLAMSAAFGVPWRDLESVASLVIWPAVTDPHPSRRAETLPVVSLLGVPTLARLPMLRRTTERNLRDNEQKQQ